MKKYKIDYLLKLVHQEFERINKDGYDLRAEILASTMHELQENPGMDVVQAFTNAMVEWDVY